MNKNQNFTETSNAGKEPETGALFADLGSVTLTNNREFNLSELLQGATGMQDRERMKEPQNVPAHADDNLIMQRNSDVASLVKNFGDRPEVQGIIAGIVLMADLFEIRQTALYATISRNQNLADLVAEVALKDPEASMREKMLVHLAEQDPLFARSAATMVARHDPDESLRVSALELLLDLDTAKALELAREFTSDNHQFNELREFAQHTLSRGDLHLTHSDEGHAVAPEVEFRAALVSTALYEQSPEVCLKAARQFLADADVAGTVALCFALLGHSHQSLRTLGSESITKQSPELARVLLPELANDGK